VKRVNFLLPGLTFPTLTTLILTSRFPSSPPFLNPATGPPNPHLSDIPDINGLPEVYHGKRVSSLRRVVPPWAQGRLFLTFLTFLIKREKRGEKVVNVPVSERKRGGLGLRGLGCSPTVKRVEGSFGAALVGHIPPLYTRVHLQGGIYQCYTPGYTPQGGIYHVIHLGYPPREAYTTVIYPDIPTQGGIYLLLYTIIPTQGGIYTTVIHPEVYPGYSLSYTLRYTRVIASRTPKVYPGLSLSDT